MSLSKRGNSAGRPNYHRSLLRMVCGEKKKPYPFHLTLVEKPPLANTLLPYCIQPVRQV
jgi:hypothetical protein